MFIRKRQPAGFTLVELMIVVALMGILAAMILPRFEPAVHDQLEGVAQTVAADLAYAQSLAVTNGSNYHLQFETEENRYVLTHSGANPLLDVLPPSPFSSPTDAPDRQTTDLDDLPLVGPGVRIVVVRKRTAPPQDVTDLEFGPLGETTRPEPTVIWLACSSGADCRYLALTIDPVTGLVSIGNVQSTPPPGIAM